MHELSVVYSVAVICFVALFLVDAIRRRRELGGFSRASLLLALVLVGLDLVVVLGLLPGVRKTLGLPLILGMDLGVLLKLTLMGALGMYYCSVLGFPRLLPRAASDAAPAPGTPEDAPDEPGVGEEAVAEAAAEVDEASVARAVLMALLVAAGATAWSWVLFRITRPQLSAMLRQLAESRLAHRGLSTEVSLPTILMLVQIACAEEVVFRLGIQNYLAVHFGLRRRLYGVAVVLTAVLWAMGHAEVLDPWWVKLVQIFPIGVALGLLARRFGAASCMVAHGAFNVAAFWLFTDALQ